MNRVLTAARMQIVHPMVILGVPWLVASLAFGINLAVWGLADIRQYEGDDGFTGGVLSLYFTVLVVFVQAVTQLLPFAMGVSLSRRTYWLGVGLVGVLSALGYGVALAAISLVERATDGWGVGLNFWTPAPLKTESFFLQVLVSGAPMLAFIAVGVALGVLYKRWGNNGVWGLVIGGLLVLGGAAVLLTWLEAWGSIGRWFADRSLATLSIGLPVAIAVVVAALSFAGIRRVVP
jgi:hypothetical protein